MFTTIKKGADLIGRNALTAHDLWHQGQGSEALAYAEQVVENCRALLQQAEQARDDLEKAIQPLR